MAADFAMVPLDMFDDKRIKARDIIVYVALLSFVDGDERGEVPCAAECYPTLKDIANRSKRSVSSVCRALRRLEAAG
jgi:DNA-binding MarR family transcriptional regulator